MTCSRVMPRLKEREFAAHDCGAGMFRHGDRLYKLARKASLVHAPRRSWKSLCQAAPNETSASVFLRLKSKTAPSPYCERGGMRGRILTGGEYQSVGSSSVAGWVQVEDVATARRIISEVDI